MSSKTTVPSGRVFRCRHCQKPFVSLEKFAVHKREAHGDVVEVLRKTDKTKSPRCKENDRRQFNVIHLANKDGSSNSDSFSSSSKCSSAEERKGARNVASYERVWPDSGKRSSLNLSGTNGASGGKVRGASSGSLTSSFEINEDSYDSDDSDDDVQCLTEVKKLGDISRESGQLLGKEHGKSDYVSANVKVALKRATPIKIEDDSSDSDDSDDSVQIVSITSSSLKISSEVTPRDLLERHELREIKREDSDSQTKTEVKQEPNVASSVTGESSRSEIFASKNFDGRKAIRPVAQVVGNSHKKISAISAPTKTSSSQGEEGDGEGELKETFKNRKELDTHAGTGMGGIAVLRAECEKPVGNAETAVSGNTLSKVKEPPDPVRRNACATLLEENGRQDLPLISPVADLQNGLCLLSASEKGETSPPIIKLKILPLEKSRYRYKCWECTEIFAKKKHMTAHAKNVHGYGVPFQCEICFDKFSQERSLARHRKIHEQNGETQYQEIEHPQDDTIEENASVKSEIGGTSTASSCGNASAAVDTNFYVMRQEHSKPPAKVKMQHQVRPSFLKVVQKARRIRKKDPYAPLTHRCGVCARKFSTLKSLQLHLKSHSDSNKYPCLHCDKRFKNIHGRKIHSSKMHGWVEAEIMDSSTLTDATSTSSPIFIKTRNSIEFQCSYCEQIFASFSQQKTHEQTHEEKPYLCQFCGVGFMTSASCKQHEASHINPKPHRCSFCSETFTTQNDKVRHVLDKHGSIPFPHAENKAVQEPRKLKVEDPMDATLSRPGIPYKPAVAEWVESQNQVHNNTELEQEPTGSRDPAFGMIKLPSGTELFPIVASKSYRPSSAAGGMQASTTFAQPRVIQRPGGTLSNSCKSTFYTTFEAKQLAESFEAKIAKRLKNANNGSESEGGDMKRPRIDENNYSCPICCKSFRGKQFITIHMLSHQASSILNGDQQGTSTPADGNQSKPKIESVDQEPEFGCRGCGLSFTDYGSLRRHEIASHSHHQCNICQKRMVSSSSLQNHLLTHKRPYACQKCTKTFDTDEKLQLHHRKHHERGKGYKCTRCGKSFVYGKALLKHKMKGDCKSKILQSEPAFPTLVDGPGTPNSAVKKLDAPEGRPENESGSRSEPFNADSSFDGMFGDTTMQPQRNYVGHEAKNGNSYSTEFYFKCSVCEKELRDRSLVDAHMKLHQVDFMLNFGLVSNR